MTFSELEPKPLKKNNYNYNEIEISLQNLYMKGSSQSYNLREVAFAGIDILRDPNNIAKEAFRICKLNSTCDSNT